MHIYPLLSTVRIQFLSRSLPYLATCILGFSLLLAFPDRSLATTNLPDRFNAGIVQLQQGNYSEALEHFTGAIERGINPGAAYGNRCLTRIHLQDYINAWQDCTRSLQHRSSATVYFHRGLAFYRLGEHDRALDDYNRSIALQPTYYPAYYNRGLVHSARKNHSLAITDFNQSLRQMTAPDPVSLASIYTDRAASYLALGNLNAARADLDRSLHLDKNYPPTYYHRACLSRRLHRFPEAIDDFNRALALDPRLADAYIQRGLLLDRLGYPRSALEDLHRGADYFHHQGHRENYRSVLTLIERVRDRLSRHANLIV
ncbi:tetratricopeptide repeat protein [Pannus brasiliensis CCIBt3594]|uniref:Tetratricopeptide repeat protein n=1 Tax=Pannus brasiliensis CCIBt3594 TaxID=1427578 RepID=A0AAW9QYV6_9CHRO